MTGEKVEVYEGGIDICIHDTDQQQHDFIAALKEKPLRVEICKAQGNWLISIKEKEE